MATHTTPAPKTEPRHPEPTAETPTQQVSDPNGTSSCADKEYFRRKQHGGTGA